jgi:hypothetical protein
VLHEIGELSLSLTLMLRLRCAVELLGALVPLQCLRVEVHSHPPVLWTRQHTLVFSSPFRKSWNESYVGRTSGSRSGVRSPSWRRRRKRGSAKTKDPHDSRERDVYISVALDPATTAGREAVEQRRGHPTHSPWPHANTPKAKTGVSSSWPATFKLEFAETFPSFLFGSGHLPGPVTPCSLPFLHPKDLPMRFSFSWADSISTRSVL